MKILMINKFFYIKGGSETYYFSLKKLLEKNGHEVIDFSMKDEKNFDSTYSDFFVQEIDYNKKQSILSKLKAGIKIIYSLEAKNKLEKLIIETKPDIAHLHIFQHQLSLSIIDVLKKYNIPIVYTAHDLKMICPNYKMLTNGTICEKCKGGKYYNCLRESCIKNSKAKSFIAMLEAYINKWRKAYEKIDYIITPSEFYRNKMIEFGVDSNKIAHIPNFLEEIETEYEILEKQDYYLYFGRLSEEKGIMTLIKAIQDTNIKLKIVGTGPLKEEIEGFIKQNKISNIEALGFKAGKELNTIVANAKSVILPSEWYENGPYSAIEALKLGRPLIGSDLGGIPELIDEKKNGFIFEAFNVENLKEKILELEKYTNSKWKELSNNSKEKFKRFYTDEIHYKEVIKVYKNVIESKKV